MWQKNWSTRRKNHSRFAQYPDRTETDLISSSLSIKLSKLLTNKLPRTSRGGTPFYWKAMSSLSACIIERAVTVV